jgi:protein-S-isoprenylcysteine O-methyltransferase Ste14
VLIPFEALSAVARIVLVISAGAFVAGEVVQVLRTRRGAKLVDVRAEAVFRVMFFGAILLWPIGRAVFPAAGIGGARLFPLGVVIAWLGLFLRHPSYTGLLLVFAGGGLITGNWVSAAGASTVLLVALIHRLRIEERALEEALGGRYRQFAANRARLVPFVW